MAGMQDSSVPPAAAQARKSPGRFAAWPVDIALAFALTLLALAGASLERSPWSAPALLLATGPLMTRRRWPLASLAAQLLGVALLGPVNQSPPAILAALAIGGYTATGVGGRRSRILAGAGAVTVVFVIHFSTRNGAVFLLLSVWLSAAAVRAMWQRSQTAERYSEALHGRQEALRTLAVAEERGRIARELHDVLGHTVSVMIIMAGAARQALPPVPEGSGESDAHAALYEVEVSGKRAMSELRHLLHLLSTDPAPDGGDGPYGDGAGLPAEELAPQPSLEHLDPLLARVRAAGLPVELIRRGTLRRLEPGLDLTAFRVVQEGLTNALKYAHGAPTEVIVEFEPTTLSLQVRDFGRDAKGGEGAPAMHEALIGGRGLLGLRERVALYGGELVAGPRHDGGFALSVRLPIEAL
jgi:signal transduction histidine kinase